VCTYPSYARTDGAFCTPGSISSPWSNIGVYKIGAYNIGVLACTTLACIEEVVLAEAMAACDANADCKGFTMKESARPHLVGVGKTEYILKRWVSGAWTSSGFDCYVKPACSRKIAGECVEDGGPCDVCEGDWELADALVRKCAVVTGDVTVSTHGGDDLRDVDDTLKEIRGNLRIMSTSDLHVVQLNGLTTIGKHLVVSGNKKLKALSLQGLSSVGEDVGIFLNPELCYIGLNNLNPHYVGGTWENVRIRTNAKMPKERVRDFSWYEACNAARSQCLEGMASIVHRVFTQDYCPALPGIVCPALEGNWGEELEKLEGRAHALHAHSELGVGVEPDEFLDDWFATSFHRIHGKDFFLDTIYPLPRFHGQQEEGWTYGLGSAHAKECLDDYKDDLVSLPSVVGNGQLLSADNYWTLYHDTSTGYALSLLDELFGGGG
jgi:hypothetical protein